MQYLKAIAAAIITPLYIASGRWRRLLEGAASRKSAAPRAELHVPTAVLSLRALSRLPLLPWKATCLYRCVAVCLLYRWSGRPALLRVGVAAAQGTTAHAWVEDDAGRLLYEQRQGWTPLSTPDSGLAATQ